MVLDSGQVPDLRRGSCDLSSIILNIVNASMCGAERWTADIRDQCYMDDTGAGV